MLLDSGASINTINQQTFRLLNNMMSETNGKPIKLLKNYQANPVAANKKVLNVIGDVKLTVFFAENQVVLKDCIFSVIPGLNAKVIIGLPALRSLEFKISNNRLELAGQQVNCMDAVTEIQKIQLPIQYGIGDNFSEPKMQHEEPTKMDGSSSLVIRRDRECHQRKCTIRTSQIYRWCEKHDY